MFRFGGSGNYPAGAFPWSGTPKVVHPGYNFLTPASAPAAEEINYVFGAMSDACAAGVSVPGCSWRSFETSPFTIESAFFTDVTSVSFNPANNNFLVALAQGASSDCNVFSTFGLGDGDLAAVNTGSHLGVGGVITSALFDGTHYFAAFLKHADFSMNVYRCTPGGAWASVFADTSTAFTDGQLRSFGGKIVLTYTSSTAILTRTSPIGDGVTWTGPGGITTPGGSAVFWAASPTLAVAFPNYGGTAHYMTTADAVTWTSRSTAFLTHGDAPFGVAYDPSTGLFVLATAGGDAQIHIFNSADGVAWSEVGAFSGATSTRGLASTAAGCLCLFTRDGAGNHAFYSVDGGVTWSWSQNFMVTPGTEITMPGIVASPFGFASWTNTGLRFSHCAGPGNLLT